MDEIYTVVSLDCYRRTLSYIYTTLFSTREDKDFPLSLYRPVFQWRINRRSPRKAMHPIINTWRERSRRYSTAIHFSLAASQI